MKLASQPGTYVLAVPTKKYSSRRSTKGGEATANERDQLLLKKERVRLAVEL